MNYLTNVSFERSFDYFTPAMNARLLTRFTVLTDHVFNGASLPVKQPSCLFGEFARLDVSVHL